LKTCPVLFVTPEADYVLGMFKRCYAPVHTGMGAPAWQRTAFPDAGTLIDQDAWLMSALDYTRDVMNRLESDRLDEAMRKQKKTGRRTE
jgi:hypothetical protein